LTGLGCPAVAINAELFWRDASVRLEYGRTDVDAYFDGWIDVGSLNREVLLPLGPGGSGRYLPALRDPISNRSVHSGYQALPARAVVLVGGEMLLGRGLDFDLTVHLSLSPAARTRRTEVAGQWTLPALDRYDREMDPQAAADIVINWNDANRPALRID
jgi:hypothetical protein